MDVKGPQSCQAKKNETATTTESASRDMTKIEPVLAFPEAPAAIVVFAMPREFSRCFYRSRR
jgi:hypothetical protein